MARQGIAASDSVKNTKSPKLFYDPLCLLHSIGRSCRAMHMQAVSAR